MSQVQTNSENSQIHIPLLRAYDDLPFPLGKKTFITYIKGDLNPTIEKHNLDEFNSYGCLFKETIEVIEELVDQLIKAGYLEERQKGYYQVLERTSFGVKEIFTRKFEFKIKSNSTLQSIQTKNLIEDEVNDEDKKIFTQFDFFLNKFNDEQKKAIISNSQNILCMAGAGSGKTTVLTKRIEFLTKFRGIKESEILAITFTKKAKEEMQERLRKLNINHVDVETFNSFSEKQLKKYGNLIYSKDTRVVSFRDKIALTKSLMQKESIHFESIKESYFTRKQLRERNNDELFFIFVRDLFAILDYFKNKRENITEFYNIAVNPTKKRIAKSIHLLVSKLNEKLKEKGLRDFSDQILDCNSLFANNMEKIPKFKHVLIDEFQDINSPQLDLIKLIGGENNFAVGDPRQAIYGWRGSEINYILNFPNEFQNTQVIALKTNYRSDPNIVSFFNKSIKSMKLPDLIAGNEKNKFEKNVFLFEQQSEKIEQIFVLEAIKNSTTPRDEIFVIARTNKVLEKFADIFEQQSIPYKIKSEEDYREVNVKENAITLATVHSIKGMEAEEVYLVSANSLSFPNKVQDNFVFDMVKQSDEYNKDDEELRLFYVALSRAKNKLIISYTGNKSKFINSFMLEHAEVKEQNKSLFDYAKTKERVNLNSSNVVVNMLKEWRLNKAKELGSIPAYMIISNSAIEGLSRLMPQSKAEMYQINGLGESKIAKYGDEILKVING